MDINPFTISVLVPSFRRAPALENCLHALSAQSHPALEVLVVLRAEDATARSVAERAGPPARVVLVDRPGQVAALNAGWRAATGEVIAITDDDAAPRPGWLRAIADRLAVDPRIGAVGGRDVVHVPGGILDGPAARVGRVLWWGRRVGNHHLASHRQDVHFLKGANMAFRARALEGFDEYLRGDGAQVCNDLEATWSVHRRGWRVVYDPEVVVDHHPGTRISGGERNERSLRADGDEQHNELYALLRHATRSHGAAILAYRLFVGTRNAPGLALLLRPGTDRGHVAGLAVARLQALRTLARRSRAAR